MDRPPDVRERIALAGVATALGLGLVTAFLPAGFWSTAPRGYAVGAVASVPGLLIGLADTDPAASPEGAVDLLLGAVLAWLVGVSVVVHGEFVVVLPGDPVPKTTLGLLAYRVWLAVTGWLPLGIVGFVLGTVVRIAAGPLRSSSLGEGV